MENKEIIRVNGKLTWVNENNEPITIVSDRAKDELYEEASYIVADDFDYNGFLLTLADYAKESDSLMRVMTFLIRAKQIMNDEWTPQNNEPTEK